MRPAVDYITLIVFLKSLQQRLSPYVPDIHDRVFKVFSRILDSKDKPNGIVANYNKAVATEDGMFIPFNGTNYLLDLLKIDNETRKKIWKHL